ncbi:MAG: hypothetical protein EA365_12790 [Gloeocapsa sp. DLM2.Bin57]|nr:MAG: hypothetical protein EA365_12790 [Gloeocapsa sp. DLM2.Bin57]
MESIKSLARNVLSEQQRSIIWEWRQQYRRSLKEYHRQWQSFWQSIKYRGNNYTCPCCGGNFREFLPYISLIGIKLL